MGRGKINHTCVPLQRFPPLAPPPSVPQVGLRESDSYLMTLSPASSSEQPIVTGGLKGTEAKVQVIDLRPQRSASEAEGVVLSQWEPRGTPQPWGQAAQRGFPVCILPNQAHTRLHPPLPETCNWEVSQNSFLVSGLLSAREHESRALDNIIDYYSTPKTKAGSPCALKRTQWESTSLVIGKDGATGCMALGKPLNLSESVFLSIK